MIKGIPDSIPDVYKSYPRAMAKVTSQECDGHNDRQTCRTANISTDSCRGMCTDAHKSTCMDK